MYRIIHLVCIIKTFISYPFLPYLNVSKGKKWQFFGNFCLRTKCLISILSFKTITTNSNYYW